MELDRNNAADLASFFAKRFPHPHQRREMVDEARVVFREPGTGGAFEAWALLLTRSQEQRALERLADVASVHDREDENLQAVCALISGRPWPPQNQPIGRTGLALSAGALVLGAVAAAALVMMTGGFSDPEPVPAAPAVVAATTSALHAAPAPVPAPEPAPVPAPSLASASAPAPDHGPAAAAPRVAAARTPVPDADPAARTAAPAPAPKTAAAPDRVPAPVPAATPAPPTPPTAPARAETAPAPAALAQQRANHSGRCTVEDGGLVGYYYAGKEAPGSKGQTVLLDRTAYVRADYPDRHNNYNARAAVRCAVLEGDQLLLTAAPILVPGDAYWVPVYSGAITGGTAQR